MIQCRFYPSTELYEKLKKRAKGQYRSLSAQICYELDKALKISQMSDTIKPMEKKPELEPETKEQELINEAEELFKEYYPMDYLEMNKHARKEMAGDVDRMDEIRAELGLPKIKREKYKSDYCYQMACSPKRAVNDLDRCVTYLEKKPNHGETINPGALCPNPVLKGALYCDFCHEKYQCVLPVN